MTSISMTNIATLALETIIVSTHAILDWQKMVMYLLLLDSSKNGYNLRRSKKLNGSDACNQSFQETHFEARKLRRVKIDHYKNQSNIRVEAG